MIVDFALEDETLCLTLGKVFSNYIDLMFQLKEQEESDYRKYF